MTTQHTPTPWRVEEKQSIAATSPGFFLDPVARCNVSGVSETDAANAAFIVQCVNEREELLAALKALAELVGKNPPPTGGISTLAQWSDGHAAALAAIAKAVAK